MPAVAPALSLHRKVSDQQLRNRRGTRQRGAAHAYRRLSPPHFGHGAETDPSKLYRFQGAARHYTMSSRRPGAAGGAQPRLYPTQQRQPSTNNVLGARAGAPSSAGVGVVTIQPFDIVGRQGGPAAPGAATLSGSASMPAGLHQTSVAARSRGTGSAGGGSGGGMPARDARSASASRPTSGHDTARQAHGREIVEAGATITSSRDTFPRREGGRSRPSSGGVSTVVLLPDLPSNGPSSARRQSSSEPYRSGSPHGREVLDRSGGDTISVKMTAAARTVLAPSTFDLKIPAPHAHGPVHKPPLAVTQHGPAALSSYPYGAGAAAGLGVSAGQSHVTFTPPAAHPTSYSGALATNSWRHPNGSSSGPGLPHVYWHADRGSAPYTSNGLAVSAGGVSGGGGGGLAPHFVSASGGGVVGIAATSAPAAARHGGHRTAADAVAKGMEFSVLNSSNKSAIPQTARSGAVVSPPHHGDDHKLFSSSSRWFAVNPAPVAVPVTFPPDAASLQSATAPVRIVAAPDTAGRQSPLNRPVSRGERSGSPSNADGDGVGGSSGSPSGRRSAGNVHSPEAEDGSGDGGGDGGGGRRSTGPGGASHRPSTTGAGAGGPAAIFGQRSVSVLVFVCA